MENEVVIHVRTKNETKAGFEAVGKDSDTQARAIGTSFSEKISNTIQQTLTQRLSGKLLTAGGPAESVGRSLGDRIGDTASQRISDKITVRLRDSRGRFLSATDGGSGGDGGRGGKGGDANVRVNVDVDKQSLFSKLFGAGKAGAAQFADGFKTGFGAVFNGDVISTVIKTLAIGALVPTIAAPLGAAIVAAVGLALGGGAIAIGVAGAFKDPRIKLAVKGTLDEVKTIFADYSSQFKPIVEDFFAPAVNSGNGGLIGVVRSLAPLISDLGRELAPVAKHLSDGIIGFLQSALPPILRGIENSRPIIDSLADKLPKLGAGIGRFFERITQGSPGAAVFLKDLLDLLIFLLDVISFLSVGAASMYKFFRTAFLGIVELATEAITVFAAAFSWIPGLGPKLDAAAGKTRQFADRMANNLKIIDRDITIKVNFRVVGQNAARAAIDTARILNSLGYAHGGVVGAATGGLHSGLRMVGEHGPELVELPPGTRVNSNPDTERMLSQDNGGQTIVVPVYLDGVEIARAVVEPMRNLVRGLGRGSVQNYLGQPGVA